MNKIFNKKKELKNYNINLNKIKFNEKFIIKKKFSKKINMLINNDFFKKKNHLKKKNLSLYKIFDIYNKQLNYHIDNYKSLKESIKSFNLITKKIEKKILNYDYKLLLGTIKYQFKGKLRTDDFFFFFKKKEKDKEFFNIFKLKNLILKETFAKLNRHGKAFKYIYDMIYRKILKYPYLITIKPKTIIILEYKNLMQYIFE